MLTDTSAQRILRATPAVLSFQYRDQDGVEADPGAITVEVVRSNGDEVLPAGTPTTGTGAAPRLVSLSPSQTAELDRFTALWSAGGVLLGETVHEVVGGFYAGVGEVRQSDKSLANTTTFTNADIVAAREEVERLFESVTGMAWVQRFEMERVDGTGTNRLLLSWPRLRKVAWCRVWRSDTAFDLLDEDDLLAIVPNRAGEAIRTDGQVWHRGVRNVEIAYVHGVNECPADLRKAALRAIRHQLNLFRSATPDRATTFTMMEGGTVTLATPGLGPWHTGIPEVDEVLKRYSVRTPSIA